MNKRWGKLVSVCTSVLTFVGTFGIPFASQAAQSRLDMAAFAHAQKGEVIAVGADGSQTLWTLGDNATAAQALLALRKDPSIAAAQPNYVYRVAAEAAVDAALEANDPLTVSQPYLDTINAYDAWDFNHDAKEVVVAVIDSGVDINHEDLEDNIWVNPKEVAGNGIDDDRNGYVDDVHGWNFVSDDTDVRPVAPRGIPENSIGIQHGTGVAGIIGAMGDNNRGIAGVAWNVKIMSLRVLNEYGVGDSHTVTRALQYAVDNGADVLNMSLVGTDYDPLVVAALKKAHDQRTIVVAAAGNSGLNLNEESVFPVCYQDGGAAAVIGVGAIDVEFNRPSFSNYGDSCVDIVAPGVKIFTTRYSLPFFDIKDQYAALFSGTSFAAPQVSGVVALLKGMRPDLTPEQVLYLLQQGATRIDPAQHVIASGFNFALNAAGSLALVSSLPMVEQSEEVAVPPVTEVPPPLVIKHPKFLAYSRGPNQGSAYQYQFPGPILVTPHVFEEDALKSGMRFTREGVNRLLVSAWKPASKFVWRYNTETMELTQVLMIDPSDAQTVGHVAIGNVDFDSQPELIIVSGPNSRPLISIYTFDGVQKYQFPAYADTVTGGLDVALLDINDDNIMEIVTVPVSQTSGHVKIFDYTGLTLNEWDAYGPNFQLGATLSVADINHDTKPEIIIGPGEGGGPHVRVFATDGTLSHEFFAGEVGESSGAIVDFYDLDEDQAPEYVVSYHSGHQSLIRTYSVTGDLLNEYGIFDSVYRGAIGLVAL